MDRERNAVLLGELTCASTVGSRLDEMMVSRYGNCMLNTVLSPSSIPVPVFPPSKGAELLEQIERRTDRIITQISKISLQGIEPPLHDAKSIFF